MTKLRIAEVATLTGVPSTTIRYYEDIGLLEPAERAENGYRVYSAKDVERLAFITRAKHLHISLDELRELVSAWDGGNCESVQFRMADVVATRLHDTQRRITELLELADQLQSASERLSTATTTGACGPSCACMTASTGAPARRAITITERTS